MKRILLTVGVVILVVAGIRAAYRAAIVPRLPTAPGPDATAAARAPRSAPVPRGPVPLLAFTTGPDAHYLALYGAPGDTVTLLAPDGPRALAPEPAASGVRCADDRYLLWTEGEELMLEIDGAAVPARIQQGRQDLLQRLWDRDVRLVAAGEEPFWQLTATADSMVLLLVGVGRYALAPGIPTRADDAPPIGRWTAEGPDGLLHVVVDEGLCLDTMAGHPYPCTATVIFGERELRGCALPLR